MPFPALDEAIEKKKAKERELALIFEDAGQNLDLKQVKQERLPAGVKSGDTRAIAALVRKLNDELTEYGQEVDNLKGVADAAERQKGGGGESGDGSGGSSGRGGDGASALSVGAAFVKSLAYKGKQGPIGPLATLDVELKTLMTTTAGWAPEVMRTGQVVDFATRPLQVTDLIPQTTTRQNAIQYMEETTFTNSATEIAEGGTYPESALALTERSSPIRKISTFIPVTDEQLEDETQVRGYLDNRLGFMIRQRLDGQILVGNGTPPNLTGINNVAGIQTQAKGTDPVPDAVYKAMVLVRVTGRAQPNLVVMHPNDWMDIRLLRTADGIYIWGNPSDAGPERIWGLRVAQSDAQTQNTGLVMDTQFLELSIRRGLDVQVSNSHSTFFVEGKQAVRADMRAALVVYRPAAVCTVTGI